MSHIAFPAPSILPSLLLECLHPKYGVVVMYSKTRRARATLIKQSHGMCDGEED
jgi:hypothetical protein